MFRAVIFRCPHLKGSDDSARCDAALCIAENDLINHIEDVNIIKLCINKKRHFEACYIYANKLRKIAINRLPMEITSFDGRPHAFGSL